MLAFLKSMGVATVVVAMVIASFYLGYILVLLAILAIVWGISNLVFNWDELTSERYLND